MRMYVHSLPHERKTRAETTEPMAIPDNKIPGKMAQMGPKCRKDHPSNIHTHEAATSSPVISPTPLETLGFQGGFFFDYKIERLPRALFFMEQKSKQEAESPSYPVRLSGVLEGSGQNLAGVSPGGRAANAP